jgi:hypothetical protein
MTATMDGRDQGADQLLKSFPTNPELLFKINIQYLNIEYNYV